MSQGIFVCRRGDSYSFRCWVPERVSSRLRSRHVVRGLRTRDPAVARFLAAAIATRIDGLWSDMAMTDGAKNEVSRLVEVWFKRELDRAWRQFRAGDDVREAVADVADPVERTARARYIQSEMADRRLDDLRDAFRADDYSEGVEAAREVVAELDSSIAEDDRRFDLIAREVVRGKMHVADAVFGWAEGNEDYTPEWQPELPEVLFPTPMPVELPVAVPEPAVVATVEPVVVAGPVASGVTLSEAFRRYSKRTEIRSDYASEQANVLAGGSDGGCLWICPGKHVSSGR